MATVDVTGVQVFQVQNLPASLDVTGSELTGAVAREFPLGAAWNRSAGWLPAISRGLARFISRFERRREAFERQFDPRTSDELLDEWEQMLDLDVPVGTSLADRRLNVLTKLRSTGGTTAAYYTSVALDFGYVVVITNAGNPATCISPCIAGLYGGEWKLIFLVTTPSQGAARDTLLEELISGQLLAGWGVVFDFT